MGPAVRTAPIRPLPVPDIPNGLWLLVDGPAACRTVEASLLIRFLIAVF